MELKAVRIIHNIETRIDFCFLAEFFRFSGIYVVECIENEENENPYQNTPDCYDVTIDTCSSVRAGESKCVDFYSIKKAYAATTVPGYTHEKVEAVQGYSNVKRPQIHQWKKSVQKKVLGTTLDSICRKLRVGNLSGVWKPIINAYVEYNLILHSMNLQFYIKKPSFAIENAQVAFYSVYRILNQPEYRLEIRNFDYARLYCMVKVNAACKFMAQDYRFRIEELAEECLSCIYKYPDFSNMKVLLGLCYEYEAKYAPLAIMAFENALRTEKQYCYSAHIYYWIGKQCEQYRPKQPDTAMNYRLSYERRHKYKNIYKMAIIERGKGNYKESINYFNKIIKKLKPKFEKNFADPLEIEYLFKAYAMIAIIYYSDFKNYLSAIDYGEYLLDRYNSFVDTSEFYPAFYGEEEGRYRILTKGRLELNRVRSIVHYSYQYLGLDEKRKDI